MLCQNKKRLQYLYMHNIYTPQAITLFSTRYNSIYMQCLYVNKSCSKAELIYSIDLVIKVEIFY